MSDSNTTPSVPQQVSTAEAAICHGDPNPWPAETIFRDEYARLGRAMPVSAAALYAVVVVYDLSTPKLVKVVRKELKITVTAEDEGERYVRINLDASNSQVNIDDSSLRRTSPSSPITRVFDLLSCVTNHTAGPAEQSLKVSSRRTSQPSCTWICLSRPARTDSS